MFNSTSCPNANEIEVYSPDPMVIGPWCQGPQQGCTVEVMPTRRPTRPPTAPTRLPSSRPTMIAKTKAPTTKPTKCKDSGKKNTKYKVLVGKKKKKLTCK